MARLPACLALLLLCASASADTEPRQRIELDASLDPRRHRIEGRARIHFVNHSRTALASLLFHLYPNAFEHERTVFMREGGGQIRGRRLQQPGHIELRSLRTPDGRDLLSGAETELVPEDHTQLRTALPVPLGPGEALDLEIEFVTVLPAIVARSGYAGEFHMLAQWFPKLARLLPSGEFAGFPYHGLGEFYADFADYTLRLRVPEGQQVAAGGVLTGSVREAGFRTDTFVAERVHDIAAAVYPDFERHALRAEQVDVVVFAPRGWGSAARRQARVAADGLRYFGAAYGPYPYPQLTLVIPPPAASAAAGMEYPTLFVSDGRAWALPDAVPDPDHDVVVAHELAHQWFSGMIASNELELPMLDEGLAEWSSLDFLRARSRLLTHPAFDPLALVEAVFLFRGQPVPSSLEPAHRYTHAKLARAIYLRPARVLAGIERRHGHQKLRAALSDYARAQRFRHPSLAELFAAFDGRFGTGFAERELRPALEGKADLAPTGPTRPSTRGLWPDLWLAAQLLLRLVGP